MKIFENDNYIILDKPSGIASQDEPGKNDSILSAFPGCHVLTRLDKRVSGLMVLAKSAEAAARWSPEKYSKTYHCIVNLPGPGKEGVLKHWIKKQGLKAKVFDHAVEGAKQAILRYQLRGKSQRYALYAVKIETGRFHQIRAQFSKVGFPLVGDLKYGYKRSTLDGSIFLSCTQIKGPDFEVEIPLPFLWAKYGFKTGGTVMEGLPA
ncbi:RluA family pseudouridine synthase [Leadbetterella byssophila]|uniref:RluA family pseudouridine synthase n=1 Tax=Leadbetterella byssophila TaxID=316068 RepID=UPI0039A22312